MKTVGHYWSFIGVDAEQVGQEAYQNNDDQAARGRQGLHGATAVAHPSLFIPESPEGPFDLRGLRERRAVLCLQ
jgi:hypothetical protein